MIPIIHGNPNLESNQLNRSIERRVLGWSVLTLEISVDISYVLYNELEYRVYNHDSFKWINYC